MTQTLPITSIFPFENRMRYFRLPRMRLIGKAMRHTNETDIAPIPRFWTEYYAKRHSTAQGLPQIVNTTLAWIAEYDPVTKQYTYMICVMCPEGTPVPEGFDHRDIGPGLMAHGTLSESPPDAHSIERFGGELARDGFVCKDGWSFEFYPVPGKNDCCLLFTVEESGAGTPE